MRLFANKNKEEFFTLEERNQIIDTIKCAEELTDGEVRVFVEGQCRSVNPLDRAAKIFFACKMQKAKKKCCTYLCGTKW